MAAPRPRPSDAERPIRKSKKQSSGFGTVLLVLLLVAGGAAAALHHLGMLGGVVEEGKKVAEDTAAKATHEFKKLTEPSPTPVVGTGTPTGAQAGSGAGSTPGATTPTLPTGAADPRAATLAKQKLGAAGDHFAAGRFREAVDVLDGFLAGRPQVGAQLAGDLELFRGRAFDHWIVTKDFARDARLDGQTTILKMVDGRELEVRITSEVGGKIAYVWKGIKSEVDAKGVLKRTDLSDDERAGRDLALYESHLVEAKGGGPRAYLAVIKYCVERDLREKIPYVVETAVKERPAFFEELFETHAALLYQRYLAFGQKGMDRERKEVFSRLLRDYPRTVITRELTKVGTVDRPPEPSAEQDQIVQKVIEEKLEPRKTSSGDPRVREILTNADARYAEAMKEYRMGFPGQPDADKHTRAAWEVFKAAQALYEKAYELENSPAIEEKISFCQREIYSCQKQFKIGGLGGK